MMQSTRVKRTIIPPARAAVGGKGESGNFTEYLAADSAHPRAGRSDEKARTPYVRQYTRPLANGATLDGRPTLVPLIPLHAMADATIFHRALHLYNAEHMTQTVWDELTCEQQDEVRAIMRELTRRRHVCH